MIETLHGKQLIKDARRAARLSGVAYLLTEIPFGSIVTWYDQQSRNWITQLKDSEGNQVGDADYAGNREDAKNDHLKMFEWAASEYIVVGPFFPPDIADVLRVKVIHEYAVRCWTTVPERDGVKKGQCQLILEWDRDNAEKHVHVAQYLKGAKALWELIEGTPRLAQGVVNPAL